MTIDKLITLRRTALGLSIERLADILNVSPHTLEAWEHGEVSDMCYPHILALSKALCVTIEALMEEEEPAECRPTLSSVKIVPLAGARQAASASKSEPIHLLRATAEEMRFLTAYRSARIGTRIRIEQTLHLSENEK